MTSTNPVDRPRGVWDEEEMREVFPEAPVRRGRGLAAGLRAEVSERNVGAERAHELTRGAQPSVIYAPAERTHGNFLDASYKRILAKPEWARRLTKAHTAKRQARAMGEDELVRGWRELDAATSSDALLMNVFCYPRVWTPGLRALMGVGAGAEVEFGVRSGAKLKGGLVNTTEIDMRVGELLVEAKLTEADFQFAPLRLVERYMAFDEVFELEALEMTRRGVRSYQLIRGVLAAHASGGRFCVLCDGRRHDLVEDWYAVVRAVRNFAVRGRMGLVAWQEVAGVVPERVRRFLAAKYGIS